MSESYFSKQVLLSFSKLGFILFRNNVGLFKTNDDRVIRTGLCVGSSDFIGWKTIQITSEMVGKNVAIFTAVEVKSKKGKPSPEQKKFLQNVKKAGGYAILQQEDKADTSFTLIDYKL